MGKELPRSPRRTPRSARRKNPEIIDALELDMNETTLLFFVKEYMPVWILMSQ